LYNLDGTRYNGPGQAAAAPPAPAPAPQELAARDQSLHADPNLIAMQTDAANAARQRGHRGEYLGLLG
jgi:hypothetical protein